MYWLILTFTLAKRVEKRRLVTISLTKDLLHKHPLLLPNLQEDPLLLLNLLLHNLQEDPLLSHKDRGWLRTIDIELNSVRLAHRSLFISRPLFEKEQYFVYFHSKASFVQSSKSWRMRYLNKCWLVLTDADCPFTHHWFQNSFCCSPVTTVTEYIA